MTRPRWWGGARVPPLYWPDPTSAPVILPPYVSAWGTTQPSEAHGINNRGQIVGGSQPDSWIGLLWDGNASSSGPSWPAGSTLTVTDLDVGSLTLTWPAATSSAGTIMSYQVFQGTTQIATLPASVLTYGVVGLSPGASCTFTVKAVDITGAVSSEGLSATVTIPRYSPPTWPPGSTPGPQLPRVDRRPGPA